MHNLQIIWFIAPQPCTNSYRSTATVSALLFDVITVRVLQQAQSRFATLQVFIPDFPAYV